jgi:hypothetical protein
MHATTITLFGQIEFKDPGTYYIEVLVDEVMKLRYPVPVLIVQQNPNQQPPAQKPPA